MDEELVWRRMKSLALSVSVRGMRRRRSVRCPDMVANRIRTRVQINDSDVDEFFDSEVGGSFMD